MKVLILHSIAGEGHRKIAESIETELRKRSFVKSIECFDAFTHTPKFWADSYPKTYFYAVKWFPKFWGFLYEFTDIPSVYRVLEPCRKIWNWLFSKPLRNYLEKSNADIIITTHFFSAQICAEMKRRRLIKSQVITVITDVMPHSFWINSGADTYWVMASESKQSLIRRGVSSNAVVEGGIPVNERFLDRVDRDQLAYDLNLDTKKRTLLFSSGSFGFGPTEQWLDELQEFGDKVQVIVVCGKNQELYNRLCGRKYTFPINIMGFVNNMHELMSVSDLLVAKSGGSTTCESLAKSLPMLITSPIPGQETRNATWLLNNHASIALMRPGDLKQFMTHFFSDPTHYKTLKANVDRIAKPDAVLQIGNYVETLLHEK